MDEPVNWEVRVSKSTDSALRSYFGSQGMEPSELSGFVEEAVRAQVFYRTVQDIKLRNAGTDADELQSIIDASVREVRSSRTTRS